MKNTIRRIRMSALLWIILGLPAYAGLILSDDFSGTEIDADKWEVVQNPPGSQAYLDDEWLVIETYGDRRTILRTQDAFSANHTLSFRFSRPEQHIGRNMTIRYGDFTPGAANPEYQYYFVWGDNGQMFAYSAVPTWGVRGSSPVLSTATPYTLTVQTGTNSATIWLYDDADELIWNLTYDHAVATQEHRLEFNNYSHNVQTDENNPLTFALDYVEIIPEPGTALLTLLGLVVLLGVRRHQAGSARTNKQ